MLRCAPLSERGSCQWFCCAFGAAPLRAFHERAGITNLLAHGRASPHASPSPSQTTLSPAQVAEFYEEHEGKPFYAGLCALMSSGPIVALALEKTNGIAAWRELLGPTNIEVAKETVRTSPSPHLCCCDKPG